MPVASSRMELDLSGAWQLAFDPAEVGHSSGWANGNWPESHSERVQVPALWNVSFPDAEGVGFYRKVFDLPPGWEGKAVLLHFEGVSYRADVWLNGRLAGTHMGGYTPFTLDVTQSISSRSPNELIVRVAALSRTKEVDGMVLKTSPASKQGWYYAFGGLWGKVSLEAVPLISCESVAIDPDLQQATIQVEVAFNNRHTHHCRAGLRLQILAPDNETVADQSSDAWLYPGMNRFAYEIKVPEPYPWDCDHPYLYQLITEIAGEEGEQDSTSTSFGMRDFTVQDGQFILNGSPLFLQGILVQPNYPVSLITPPDPEMMAREISLAKEAGFNIIRIHLRPAPPGYLELTDRMGILVYAETSLGWIRDSPRLLEHGRREIQEMIARDRNHPSIVFWGIYNENPSVAAVSSAALVRFTRSLDPTRVVVDNSGGTMAIDQDFGWGDRATVVPNRETERQEIQDIHLYLGCLVPEPVYAWERKLGAHNSSGDLLELGFGKPEVLAEFDRGIQSYQGKIFVSELGCGGMSDLEDTVAQFQGNEHLLDSRELRAFRDSLQEGFARRRLGRIFASVKDLAQAAQELQAAGNTRHIEAVLANPRVSGYILTQLNDVAWEFHAGIVDLWRRPKLAYEAVKRLNQPHVLILNISRTVAPPGGNFTSNLVLINRAPFSKPAQVAVNLLNPDGEEAVFFEQGAPMEAGIHPIGTIPLASISLPGKYRLTASIVNDQGSNSQTAKDFWVLPAVDWTSLEEGLLGVGKCPPWAARTRGPACSSRSGKAVHRRRAPFFIPCRVG